MKIDFGAHTIERIGAGWRMRPGAGLSEAQLAQHVDNWQQLVVEPLSGAKLTGTSVVVVWLAGQPQGVVFEVKPENQTVLIQHQGRLYEAVNHTLNDLIPEEIR